MGVYEGIILVERSGDVVDAEMKAVRTAMVKKLIVATKERGDRRETPQRK